MRRFIILAAAITITFGIAGAATALTVGFENGTTYNTTAITGSDTDGSMMDGMKVTATFLNGSTETITWADTPAVSQDSGGATGTGWSLNVKGNTFSMDWELKLYDNTVLANLFIDAGPGDTVFDVKDLLEYTPGSLLGKKITTSSYNGDLAATYSDLVGILDDQVYGDLYRTLNLGFGTDGLSIDIKFVADTDNLSLADDLEPAEPGPNPGPNPVPEPATLLLLGTGLAGLAGFGRKKFLNKR